VAKMFDIAMARPDPRSFRQPGAPFLRAEFAPAVAYGVDLVCAASAGPLKKWGCKSVASIESGKWIDPAKIGFQSEIVTVNDVLTANPGWPIPTPTGRAGWCACGPPMPPRQVQC